MGICVSLYDTLGLGSSPIVHVGVSATFQGLRDRPFFYPIYMVIYLKWVVEVTKNCNLFIRGSVFEKG